MEMRNGTVTFQYSYIARLYGNPAPNTIRVILRGLASAPPGYSQLQNVAELLNSRATNREKAEYFVLASMRNPFHMNTENDRTLNLSVANTKVSTERILKNRLLRLQSNRVYFYYEDISHGY